MLTLVPESDFGERQLQEHAVWARYYDPDEIEEVVSWGIDRTAFLKALEQAHDGSDHAMYPVMRTDPLPESLDLYVRAEFVTPGGRRLTGYINGTEANFVTLFCAKDQFSFSSTSLPDLNLEDLARLRRAIGDAAAVIFTDHVSHALSAS
jgi:hypothetical protein